MTTSRSSSAPVMPTLRAGPCESEFDAGGPPEAEPVHEVLCGELGSPHPALEMPWAPLGAMRRASLEHEEPGSPVAVLVLGEVPDLGAQSLEPGRPVAI